MTAATNKNEPLTPLERTKKLAVAMLDRRPLSEAELRKRLADKGCAPEDIDAVTALCLDYGFLNDAEYAAMLGRCYGAKRYGAGRLRMELRRRGVAEEYWDGALDQLDDPAETLDRLLAARLRGRDAGDRKEIEKAGAALFRRGYSWDEIRAAVNRYRGS